MTIVILAAGASRRMGCPKLLLPIEGRTMIECVIEAAAAWPIVVVAGDDVAATLGSLPLRIVRNAMPERGMAHSLALADAAIGENEPLAVLLADIPDITSETIAQTIARYNDDVDVVIARIGETPAHPIVFGPRARRKIRDLPDGDTIKRIRDDPALRRCYAELSVAHPSDIDTPAEYHERTGRWAPPVESSR